MPVINFSTQHVSTHNTIYSFCNADNIYVHTDTNNSTSTGNKKWQHTLTSYHKHVTMSTVKQCWNIESPVTTPQSTELQVAVKRPSKTAVCVPIHKKIAGTRYQLKEHPATNFYIFHPNIIIIVTFRRPMLYYEWLIISHY